MRRIIINGSTGSGKTTLGQALSQQLNIPFVDLDDLHWLPDWQARGEGDFRAVTTAALAGDAWVVAGNYSAVRDIVWGRGDTLVWLDYGFLLVFRRLLVRSWRRLMDKSPVCNGNTETLRQMFSRHSIILWLFRSFRRRRRQMQVVFENPVLYPHLTYTHHRTPAETARWLQTVLTP